MLRSNKHFRHCTIDSGNHAFEQYPVPSYVRLLWMVLTVAFMAFQFYQIVYALKRYHDQPHLIVQRLIAKSKFPDVSICSLNPYKRSLKLHEDGAETMTVDLEKKTTATLHSLRRSGENSMSRKQETETTKGNKSCSDEDCIDGTTKGRENRLSSNEPIGGIKEKIKKSSKERREKSKEKGKKKSKERQRRELRKSKTNFSCDTRNKFLDFSEYCLLKYEDNIKYAASGRFPEDKCWTNLLAKHVCDCHVPRKPHQKCIDIQSWKTFFLNYTVSDDKIMFYYLKYNSGILWKPLVGTQSARQQCLNMYTKKGTYHRNLSHQEDVNQLENLPAAGNSVFFCKATQTNMTATTTTTPTTSTTSKTTTSTTTKAAAKPLAATQKSRTTEHDTVSQMQELTTKPTFHKPTWDAGNSSYETATTSASTPTIERTESAESQSAAKPIARNVHQPTHAVQQSLDQAGTNQDRVLDSEDLSEVVLQCRFNERVCDLGLFKKDYKFGQGVCFTYNHEVTSAGQLGREKKLELLLALEPDEYQETTQKMGHKVILHSPNETILARYDGINLDVNTVTEIIAEYTESTQLKTDANYCVESDETYQPFYYDGRYRPEGCLESSMQRDIMKTCDCIDPQIRAPQSDMKKCSTDNPCMKAKRRQLSNPHCPGPCTTRVYGMTVTKRRLQLQRSEFSPIYFIFSSNSNTRFQFIKNDFFNSVKFAPVASSSTNSSKRIVKLVITTPRMEHVYYQPMLIYDYHALFSQMGSLLGMLGMSILAVMEIPFLIYYADWRLLTRPEGQPQPKKTGRIEGLDSHLPMNQRRATLNKSSLRQLFTDEFDMSGFI